MTPSEHLRLAAALIADEKRWTQKATARSADGKLCSAKSQSARQWCAIGGVIKVSQDRGSSFAAYKFKEVYGHNLSSVNDHNGHAYTIGAMMHVADKLDGLA